MRSQSTKYYPFLKCLHPKVIVNPVTLQHLEVGCGVCKACLQMRANKASFLCSMEEQSHKYNMFVTLTYNTEYLPYMHPVKKENGDIYFVNDCSRVENFIRKYQPKYVSKIGVGSDNSVLGILSGESASHFDSDKIFKRVRNVKKPWYRRVPYGYIPFLAPSDLQQFMKNLRYELNRVRKTKKLIRSVNKRTGAPLKHPIYEIQRIQWTSEEIRYYAVGEYGPHSFRPHFHLDVHFDCEETFSHFIEACSASWPFGHVDVSLVRNNVSSYIAKYLNCSVSLPSLYSLPAFKPKSFHSLFYAFSLLKGTQEEVYKNGFKSFVERSCLLNGKYVNFMPWRSLTSWFYPKCQGFSYLPYNFIRQSYTILLKCYEVYGKTKSIAFYRDNIVNDIHDFVINPVTEFFYETYKLRPSYDGSDESSFSKSSSLESSVYSVLTTSRHFLTIVCQSQDTSFLDYVEIDSKINLIRRFYKWYDLYQLNLWYSKISDFTLSQNNIPYLINFYFTFGENGYVECLDGSSDAFYSFCDNYNYDVKPIFLKDSELYYRFKSDVENNFLCAQLRKVHNDLNLILNTDE